MVLRHGGPTPAVGAGAYRIKLPMHPVDGNAVASGRAHRRVQLAGLHKTSVRQVVALHKVFGLHASVGRSQPRQPRLRFCAAQALLKLGTVAPNPDRKCGVSLCRRVPQAAAHPHQGASHFQPVPMAHGAQPCNTECSTLNHSAQRCQYRRHSVARRAWPQRLSSRVVANAGVRLQQARQLAPRHRKRTAQHHVPHPSGMLLRVSQRDHRPPRSCEHAPALYAQVLAQCLQVGNQHRRGVAGDSPTWATGAGASLIRDHSPLIGQVQGLQHACMPTCPRAPMQQQPGLTRWVAHEAIGHAVRCGKGQKFWRWPVRAGLGRWWHGVVGLGIYPENDMWRWILASMLRTLEALARQSCQQACKHVSCQSQLEINYAVDHAFFHRPSLRLRNHDVHRQPLSFSG